MTHFCKPQNPPTTINDTKAVCADLSHLTERFALRQALPRTPPPIPGVATYLVLPPHQAQRNTHSTPQRECPKDKSPYRRSKATLSGCTLSVSVRR